MHLTLTDQSQYENQSSFNNSCGLGFGMHCVDTYQATKQHCRPNTPPAVTPLPLPG